MRPVLFLLLAGCESGLASVVDVEVADTVATAQTEDAPGVLVTDAGRLAPLAALCGQALDEPVTFSFDFGFGCLDERQGTTAVLRAWVQPMPERWDAAAFCALAPTPYSGLTIGPAVIGGDDTAEPAAVDTAAPPGDTGDDTGAPVDLYPGLAAEPDPAWPQGETTATWKRDVSPCGGVLKGDIRVE